MKEFLELAAERYSVRKYQTTPVEEEKLCKILEAAKLAPTACNYQPQKIYVVRDPAKLEQLAALTPCTFKAPLVFLIGFDVERSAKGLLSETHDFGDTDAAIVATHMMLEAADLGLGTCMVGYFVEAKVKEALGLPENFRLRLMLPTGYPAESSRPGPMHGKSREMADMVSEL